MERWVYDTCHKNESFIVQTYLLAMMPTADGKTRFVVWPLGTVKAYAIDMGRLIEG